MSHSKDKDFNETGKWQEAILFIYLTILNLAMCVAKQIGSFKVRLSLHIEMFQTTWTLTGAGHNFAKIGRDLINLLPFYSSKISDTCCLSSLFLVVLFLVFKIKDDFRNRILYTWTGGLLFSLLELWWGDQWSIMEELDGKLDAFYSFRTLIFVVFALAVFAVMCFLNFMSTLITQLDDWNEMP